MLDKEEIKKFICDTYKARPQINLNHLAQLSTEHFDRSITSFYVSMTLEHEGLRNRKVVRPSIAVMYDAQIKGDGELLDLPRDLIKNMVCKKKDP